MMKLLFVDHECHRKTGSTGFLPEIVREAFDVEEIYYANHYRTGAEKAAASHDIVVSFEFLISRWKFYLTGKRNVFVPMYDNEWASVWQWRRIAWSGVGVISFCQKVSDHARRCGVKNILDVRYFPECDGSRWPQCDPKRVFLWERGEISRWTAERLFPPEAGYSFDVKGADEFLSREEYFNRMSRCGIVIAPRSKEGIGMAFLEAMAMGKCVVACDDATMNEYIAHGENGILFHLGDPKPVDEAMVRHVLENVGRSAAEFRARWLQDKAKINTFIADQRPCNPSFVCRLKMALSYPLFLLEGVAHVLKERLTKATKGDA